MMINTYCFSIDSLFGLLPRFLFDSTLNNNAITAIPNKLFHNNPALKEVYVTTSCANGTESWLDNRKEWSLW